MLLDFIRFPLYTCIKQWFCCYILDKTLLSSPQETFNRNAFFSRFKQIFFFGCISTWKYHTLRLRNNEFTAQHHIILSTWIFLSMWSFLAWWYHTFFWKTKIYKHIAWKISKSVYGICNSHCLSVEILFGRNKNFICSIVSLLIF